MGSANEVDVVLVVEVFDDDLAEGVGDTSVIFTPVDHVLLGVCRITPEQIAQKAWIWDIGGSQNFVDLLQVVQLGREASVDAEDLVVYDGRHWEAIEALNELFPEL